MTLFTCQQFPVNARPWSSHGLRRASVNSFGFGGSNAHAVLDDAYHFLKLKGLIAHHCTVEKPPQIYGDDNQHVVSNGISQFELSSNGQRECLPKTNDIPNGKSYSSDFNATSIEVLPKILVWSASDEGGIDRLMDVWQEYSLKPLPANVPEEIYMDKLAYTLGHRRSSLPWKSFALVDSASKLAQIKSLISRPVHSREENNIGFIFTGQGAVYNRMGVALLGSPVFRNALESFERKLMLLGASGQCSVRRKRLKFNGNQTSRV